MNTITSPRRFLIDSMARLIGVVGFIQTLDLSKPVEVIIQRPKRTNQQNRRYWAMLGSFAAQYRAEGRLYPAECWHEYFKRKHLGVIEVRGEIMAAHSKDKDIPNFAEYMSKVEADLLADFGFQLD